VRAVYICERPDRCEKHGQKLHGYPCDDCQTEWRRTHPRTAVAISELMRGRGSVAKYRAAAKADNREARARRGEQNG
jgi:hypothetical protein